MTEVKKRPINRVRRVLGQLNEFLLNDISFVALLGILVFTVFLLPVLIEYGHFNLFFVNLVFLFLFFTGIWSSNNPYLIGITAFLFFCQLTLKLLRFTELQANIYLLERIFGLLNMGVFIFVNLRLLFRDQEANLYRVIGAVNVYLLLAVMGAFGFEVIHLLVGSSITGAPGGILVDELSGLDKDFSTYIYFSLVSLTTVGFGDYTPINVLSKMLATFLSTVGMLYPAVVIARLVASSVKS